MEKTYYGSSAESDDTSRSRSARARFGQQRETSLEEVLCKGLESIKCQEDVYEVYRQLQESNDPELLCTFETLLVNILHDVSDLKLEKQQLEGVLDREKSRYEELLVQVEDDVKDHLARAEAEVKQQEQERTKARLKEIEYKYESELKNLQEELTRMSARKVVEVDEDELNKSRWLRTQLQDVSSENRKLQSLLRDYETNVTLLQSELLQIKHNYEDSRSELGTNQNTLSQYEEDQEKLLQHVELLHQANRKLQETNDELITHTATATRKGSRPKSVPPGRRRRMPVDRRDTSARRSNQDDVAPSRSKVQNLMSIYNDGNARAIPNEEIFFTVEDVDSNSNKRHNGGKRKNSRHARAGSVDSSSESDTMEDSGHLQVPSKSLQEELDDALAKEEASVMKHDNGTLISGRAVRRKLDIESDDEDDVSVSTPPTREALEATSELIRDAKIVQTLSDSGWSEQSERSSTPVSLGAEMAEDWDEQKDDGDDEADVVNHEVQKTSSNVILKPKVEVKPTQMAIKEQRTFKVILAGDAAVGKSSFIWRLCKGKFVQNLPSTVGVDYYLTTITLENIEVTLQLWDTAGQERFRSVTRSYFRRADGVLLLYDVMCETSFLSVREWLDMIRESTDKECIPVMICANKIDLSDRYKVPKESGVKLAKSYSSLFCETSVKTGTNLNEAVEDLARWMIVNEDVEIKTSSFRSSSLRKLTTKEDEKNKAVVKRKNTACCK